MSDLREKFARVIDPISWEMEGRTTASHAVNHAYEEQRALSLERADAILALLPPAPDGATEGSYSEAQIERAAREYHARTRLDRFEGRGPDFERQSIDAMRAAIATLAPPVSPVGPKGEEGLGSYSASEEAAPSGATASWRDLAEHDGRPGWAIVALPDGPDGPDGEVLEARLYDDHFWRRFGANGAKIVYPTHFMPLPNPPGAGVSSWRHGKPPSVATYADNPSSQPSQTGEENAGLVEEALSWADPNRPVRQPPAIADLLRRLADALASQEGPHGV